MIDWMCAIHERNLNCFTHRPAENIVLLKLRLLADIATLFDVPWVMMMALVLLH